MLTKIKWIPKFYILVHLININMDTTYIDEILILRNTIIREHKNKNRKSKLLTMIKELREKEKDIYRIRYIYS